MATSEKLDYGHYTSEDVDAAPANINSVLVNPFIGLRHEKMEELIETFIDITKIEDIYLEVIRKGAFLAQDSEAFRSPRTDNLRLKPDEIETLRQEDPKTGNKWNQPWILYALVGTSFPSPPRVLQHVMGASGVECPSDNFRSGNPTEPVDADSGLGCCSLGAAVQGWDETAVNGAQLVGLLGGATLPVSISPAA